MRAALVGWKGRRTAVADFYTSLTHFNKNEFEYPYKMDHDLLRKLDVARTLAGIPFVITSDFRTEAHNDRIGGAENSAHLRGLAVDIRCSNSGERYIIYDGLRTAGFRRIGLADGFIHADTDATLPQEVTWLY